MSQNLEKYEATVGVLIDDYENETDLFEYININYLVMDKKKSIKNRFSYLLKALKEDYALARSQMKFAYEIE